MKLKDLLKEALLYPTFNSDTTEIMGETLQQIKDSLLKCEEFIDVDELVLLDAPRLITETKSLVCTTMKIGSNTKFKKRAYVYSIYLSSTCFNIDSLSVAFENGANILPKLYDTSNMDFIGNIILQYNPKDENYKENLHKLLNDVLEDPEKYESIGERSIMIRGIFEEIEVPVTKIETIKSTID